MKKIKFRAWDKEKKEIIDVRDFQWDAEGGLECQYGCQTSDEWHGSDTLMQYTGLKDKNGKEIYEGDVGWNMSDEAGETKVGNHEIVFESGSFRLKNRDGKVIKRTVRGGLFEIIGNIYENPELLK